MVANISPNDFRIRGEKAALYIGLGILTLILFFLGVVTAGIFVLVVVPISALVVWIQQRQLLGGCVKVSPTQFPDIYSISQEAAARLGMQSPELFIRQDPTLNAFAIGFLGKKSVVLNSATVEAMEKAELEQIIGHEFSHIKCGHTNFLVLTSSAEGVDIPIISKLLGFVFLFWSRKAEYTCDRGGLLASRDPKAAISAMCKLAVGPSLFKQMHIEEFLRQHMTIDQDDFTKLSETFTTHPYLVKRICAIQQFYDSELYRRLVTQSL